MADHVFVEGVENRQALTAMMTGLWKSRVNKTLDEQDMINKGTEQAMRKKINSRAVCDRCKRTWPATLTDDGMQARIAESAYPQAGSPLKHAHRLIDLLPASVCNMANDFMVLGNKMFWMSPTSCPGNTDGSCLALAPASYWECPMSIWNKRHTFGDGKLRNDMNATYEFKEWMRAASPNREALSDSARHTLEARYPDTATGSGPSSWRTYLSWRLVWIQYWTKGGSRSSHHQIPRMWGHVEADAALHDMDLLSAADFEAIYCMPLKVVEAIWERRSFKAIDSIEQFAGVRRDLSQKSFARAQSVILKYKHAIQKWTECGNWWSDEIAGNKLVDLYNTMMFSMRLPSEKSFPGELPRQEVPAAPVPAASVALFSLDEQNLEDWFVQHVVSDQLTEFEFRQKQPCGCQRPPLGGPLLCELAYQAQRNKNDPKPAPVTISGTEVPLPVMAASITENSMPYVSYKDEEVWPPTPFLGNGAPPLFMDYEALAPGPGLELDSEYYSASPSNAVLFQSQEIVQSPQGIVERNMQGNIVAYTSAAHLAADVTPTVYDATQNWGMVENTVYNTTQYWSVAMESHRHGN
ncbi:hypothetical protein ACHAQH_007675 [Verticillium albo-atrum]